MKQLPKHPHSGHTPAFLRNPASAGREMKRHSSRNSAVLAHKRYTLKSPKGASKSGDMERTVPRRVPGWRGLCFELRAATSFATGCWFWVMTTSSPGTRLSISSFSLAWASSTGERHEEGINGGSVWESNPLRTFFKPPTGFEDQGPHQRCKHFLRDRFSAAFADCTDGLRIRLPRRLALR